MTKWYHVFFHCWSFKFVYKVHWSYLFYFILWPPVGILIKQYLFYLPVAHCFKCLLIVQLFILGISHTYICHTSITLTPCITYSFSVTLFYYSRANNAFHYTAFIHKCNVLQCYSISVILFSSATSYFSKYHQKPRMHSVKCTQKWTNGDSLNHSHLSI
jgi:hypothetical protein